MGRKGCSTQAPERAARWVVPREEGSVNPLPSNRGLATEARPPLGNPTARWVDLSQRLHLQDPVVASISTLFLLPQCMQTGRGEYWLDHNLYPF